MSKVPFYKVEQMSKLNLIVLIGSIFIRRNPMPGGLLLWQNSYNTIFWITLRAVIFAERNFCGTNFCVGRSKNCEFRGINFRDWVIYCEFRENYFCDGQIQKVTEGVDVLYVETGGCAVLGSFVHHTVDVPIQSRKRVDESILGKTSTCKEVDNNFCNKKSKIGQVKGIRAYYTNKLKEPIPPTAPKVIE